MLPSRRERRTALDDTPSRSVGYSIKSHHPPLPALPLLTQLRTEAHYTTLHYITLYSIAHSLLTFQLDYLGQVPDLSNSYSFSSPLCLALPLSADTQSFFRHFREEDLLFTWLKRFLVYLLFILFPILVLLFIQSHLANGLGASIQYLLRCLQPVLFFSFLFGCLSVLHIA